MPTWNTIGVFLAATAVLVVAPGPIVLYLIACSLERGRRAALIAILGVGTGTLVHVIAATVILSCLVILLGFCNDSAYVLLAGMANRWLQKKPQLLVTQQYFAGSIYLLLGITAAVTNL